MDKPIKASEYRTVVSHAGRGRKGCRNNHLSCCEFHGFRGGRFQGPFGHVWIVSKVIEEASPKEMQKRMDAMMSGIRENALLREANKPISSGKRRGQSRPRNQRRSEA